MKRKFPPPRTWKQNRCFHFKGRLTSLRENLKNMVGRSDLFTGTEITALKTALIYMNDVLKHYDTGTLEIEKKRG